jgi:hypothetical protein
LVLYELGSSYAVIINITAGDTASRRLFLSSFVRPRFCFKPIKTADNVASTVIYAFQSDTFWKTIRKGEILKWWMRRVKEKQIHKTGFLHIVMKVALFYTQNRSESSTFLYHFIPSP